MTFSDSHIEDSLYQISRAVHDSNNLNLLFKELHAVIRKSISIDNFYVALMNRDLDLLTYPYYQDVKDNPPKEKFSKSRGVTHYALMKEEKMIISKSDMQTLIDNKDLELIGTLPYYWLGVPLKDFKGSTIGLISIQTYKPNVTIDESHLKLMSFIAEQLTLAIERFQHLKEVKYLTYYDPLTELPNRSLFFEEGAKIVHNDDDMTACLFIDLDDYMLINDTHGDDVTNKFLQNISYNLASLKSDNIHIYYWGADKFTVIISGAKDLAEIKKKTKEVRSKVSRTIKVNGETIIVTCSIGVSMSPIHSNNINDLCRDSDIAMHQAKQKGKNRIQYFEEYMKDVIITNYGMGQSLKEAVNKNQWEVYYQPQIDFNTDKIIGFEALIRWNHPEKGLVMPSSFIATAETNDSIFEIGEYVLKEVCRQTSIWNKEQSKDLIASVNLSAREFERKNLIKLIDSTLEESKLDPKNLIIEITENTFLNDTAKKINEIKDRGIKVSIDDFGTGYSSLGYLYEYSIDAIKIDKSFVRNIDQDKQKKILSNSIINLANNLELDIVTEGVENKNELDFFTSKKCSKFQGYFFSKPLPKKDFENLILSS